MDELLERTVLGYFDRAIQRGASAADAALVAILRHGFSVLAVTTVLREKRPDKYQKNLPDRVLTAGPITPISRPKLNAAPILTRRTHFRKTAFRSYAFKEMLAEASDEFKAKFRFWEISNRSRFRGMYPTLNLIADCLKSQGAPLLQNLEHAGVYCEDIIEKIRRENALSGKDKLSAGAVRFKIRIIRSFFDKMYEGTASAGPMSPLAQTTALVLTTRLPAMQKENAIACEPPLPWERRIIELFVAMVARDRDGTTRQAHDDEKGIKLALDRTAITTLTETGRRITPKQVAEVLKRHSWLGPDGNILFCRVTGTKYAEVVKGPVVFPANSNTRPPAHGYAATILTRPAVRAVVNKDAPSLPEVKIQLRAFAGPSRRI